MTPFERRVTRVTLISAITLIAATAALGIIARRYAISTPMVAVIGMLVTSILLGLGSLLCSAGYFGYRLYGTKKWPFCTVLAAPFLLAGVTCGAVALGMIVGAGEPMPKEIRWAFPLFPVLAAAGLSWSNWRSNAIPAIGSIFIGAEVVSYALFRYVL